MRLNKNIKIFFNYFLGPALFIWLTWSIYQQVKSQPNLEESWKQIKESLSSSRIWYLIAVFLLMIVNWSLEAQKWRISIHHIQPVGFFRALRAILSGVSFSVTTPNRIGEYLGRVLYMEEGNRLRAVSLTIVSSMSQLIITLLVGSMGLMILRSRIETGVMIKGIDLSLWIQVLQYGVLIVVVLLTLLYFRLSVVTLLIDKIKRARPYAFIVNTLNALHATLLLKLLSLSAIRYFVFIIQYMLLFRLFGVEVSWWEGIWSVSVIFLVLAILPTFAIAELGLRNEVGFKILGLFTLNKLGILWATATIWFINLVIPAIIGSLLILNVKIFKSKNEGN